MKKLDLPYIRITRLNELVRRLSPSFIEKKGIVIGEFCKALGEKIGTVSNMLVTLRALHLVKGRGNYDFTEEGKQYAISLIRNNEAKSREVLVKICEGLDYITEIRQWLKQKGKLEINEIGNQIALKFNQKWENPVTVRAYGAAIGSIIDYIGQASYRSGTLLLPDGVDRSDTLPVPDVHVRKIIVILNGLFPEGKELKELSKAVKTSEGRLSSELMACIELGLVERAARGFYKLKKPGKDMISPMSTDEHKRSIFRKQLLGSGYSRILKELGNETTIGEMARIIPYMMGKSWNERTSTNFARKFMNWLVFAGIMEKKGKRYLLTNGNLQNEMYIEAGPQGGNAREMITSRAIDPVSYYLLGKYVGQILNPTKSREIVTDAVSKIIGFCREDAELRGVLENWKEDYDLYHELGDSRIFLRDIKALEKALGVKL
ncbi:MAG: hypothetical protein JRI31_12020 [Deltaproteobacteria bacterium]|nr:hypothetical protein [Deltaproteobacteria bacterium]